jgi:protein-S-isoprenylcysteine O-methyltransferase Ste14
MAHRTGRRWVWLHNVPVPPAHVVAIGIGVLADRRHPLPLAWRDSWRRPAGAACTAAGVAVVARSVAVTTAVRLDDPARLVTTGPYAVSRNPMYLGWSLLHLGVALLARSGWTLTLLVVAAARVHHEIRAEERMLGDRFGPEYSRYRATVPQYLGHRLRPPHHPSRVGNTAPRSVEKARPPVRPPS